MKKKVNDHRSVFLFLLITLSSLDGFCQVPYWVWAKSASGRGFDRASAITHDPEGNLYITGYLVSDTVFFDTIPVIKSDTDYINIYLAKYSATGNALWVKMIEGYSINEGLCLSSDQYGNIYLGGYFSDSFIMIGSFPLYNLSVPTDEMFIAKFDSAGNALWAKNCAGYSKAHGIVCDAPGNVYVTGMFGGDSASFDSVVLHTTISNDIDIFVVKYDQNGNLLWAKKAAGAGPDYGRAISTDPFGNLFVSGYFGSTLLIFDTDTLIDFSSGNDIFIARYDTAGNIRWVRKNHGPSWTESYASIADPFGNVYVSGIFSDSIIVGTDTLVNSNNYFDLYITKYDSGGNFQWAKSGTGGFGSEIPYSMDADAAGNIYMAGNCAGPFYLDSVLVNSVNNFNFFVVKFGANGITQWAKTTGTDQIMDALSVSVNGSGDAALGGFFRSSTIDFGNTTLVNTTFYSEEIFLAQLGISTTVAGINSSAGLVIVFPNPFTTEINLSGIKEGGEIVMYDLPGKEILRIKAAGNSIMIKTSLLKEGFYIIKYSEGDLVGTIKLIKID